MHGQGGPGAGGPDAADGSGAGGPGRARRAGRDGTGARSAGRRLGDPERAGAVGRHRRQRRDRAAARRRHAPRPADARPSSLAVKQRLADVVDRLPDEVRHQLLRVVPNDDPRKCELLTTVLDDLPTQRLLDLVPARRHEARHARQPVPDVPRPPLLGRRPRGVGQRGGRDAARSLRPADRPGPRRQRPRPRRPRAGLQPDRRALQLRRRALSVERQRVLDHVRAERRRRGAAAARRPGRTPGRRPSTRPASRWPWSASDPRDSSTVSCLSLRPRRRHPHARRRRPGRRCSPSSPPSPRSSSETGARRPDPVGRPGMPGAVPPADGARAAGQRHRRPRRRAVGPR